MGWYVTKRLGQAFIVLSGITLLGATLARLVPGNPARVLLGYHASQQAVNALSHELGLDRPLLSQYGAFVGGLFHGHLGTSIAYNVSVSSLIGARIIPTVLLISYSLTITVGLAIPLAVLAATHRNGKVDHLIRLVFTASFAMPSFWVALLLVLVFSLHLGLLPVSGYGSTFPQHLECLTLPAITIGLWVAPPLVRTLRATLIEHLASEYVESARARGLTERRVVLRHALPNSLAATLTLLGVFVGGLLTATVAVENVFALPGLGSLLVSSVSARDFPTVEALLVIFAATVVVINLLTDLLYPMLDPRVQL